MRTSTFVRAGVVLTASALAFSLGAGPATAAESATATGKATQPSTSKLGSASSVGAAGTISVLRLGSGTITDRATTQFVGTVAGSAAPGTTAQVDVRINGRGKGRVQLYPGNGNGGVEIPRGWGSGRVQVGPTYFSDGTVDGHVSNTFYARKQVRSKATYPLKIRRVNSSITFRAYGVKIINPASGKYQSVKRVKLQQLKGGKWKTKKTIKLNSSGNGKYKTSLKKKYRYRLYVPRTSTQEKFETVKTGKI
ncbi:MAG: hypothetical protein ABWZ87_05650 [Aeromicrobium sp.]